jgi:hypothetical protein
MSRWATLEAACVQCKKVLRENGVSYCRNCLDAVAATILDASRSPITCDLRCRTVGLELLATGGFVCCEGEVT